MRHIIIVTLAVIGSLFALSAHAQPRPPWYWRWQHPVTSAYRAVVELEVNGRPLTYERTVGCRGTAGRPGGRADLHVMSHRVKNPETEQEEAVIVHQPDGCAMMQWYRRHEGGRDLRPGEEIDVNNDVYGARSPGWPDYVPLIRYAIPADDPEVIHEYRLAANLEPPDSRVRFKSIRIFVASPDDKREPYDEFHWLVRVEGPMESGQWDRTAGVRYAREMYKKYWPFFGLRFVPEKAWRRIPELVAVYDDETETRVICQEELNFRRDSLYQHRDAWYGAKHETRAAGRLGGRIERGRGVFHPNTFGQYFSTVEIDGNLLRVTEETIPAPLYLYRKDLHPTLPQPQIRQINDLVYQSFNTRKPNPYSDSYTLFDHKSKRVFSNIACASVCPCWDAEKLELKERVYDSR